MQARVLYRGCPRLLQQWRGVNKVISRGNSIKCLEVLSKKMVSQTRQSKTRKGSRMNRTYDIRSPLNGYKRRSSSGDVENDNLLRKMEILRKEK